MEQQQQQQQLSQEQQQDLQEQFQHYKYFYQYNFNQEEQEQLIYPLNMTLSQDQQFIFLSMSNGSIQVLQQTPDQLKQIANLENAHDKKIHQLLVEDNMLISASNDGTVKLWDINNGFKKIHTFEKSEEEITSITKSKHILAGGTDKELVQFWDLQKMQERGQFEETLTNEVTSVNFNKNVSTALLASSLDGMVCLFDLTQEDEEDSVSFLMRMSQPIDRCNFFGDSAKYAYAISTSNTIDILDMEQSKVILHIDTINYSEYNQNYLIDVYENKLNELRYFLGDHKGFIDEITIEQNKIYKKKIQSGHTELITCCKYNNDRSTLISCGQDGMINLSKYTDQPFTQVTQIEMEMMKYQESQLQQENLDEESNMIKQQRQQQQKKPAYNPF